MIPLHTQFCEGCGCVLDELWDSELGGRAGLLQMSIAKGTDLD